MNANVAAPEARSDQTAEAAEASTDLIVAEAQQNPIALFTDEQRSPHTGVLYYSTTTLTRFECGTRDCPEGLANRAPSRRQLRFPFDAG